MKMRFPLALAAVLAALAGADDLANGGQHLNVLLICVDDLRTELGCYGNEKIQTPNIDRLARRGILYERAYTQVALCNPSRNALLSGRYPRTIDNSVSVRTFLPAAALSLPAYFKEHGYATISIGKVFHNDWDDPGAWTRRYTETFADAPYVCTGWAGGYQLAEHIQALKMANGQSRVPPLEHADRPDDAYPDGLIAKLAEQVVEQYSTSRQPLFLATGFYRPHLPWVIPRRYWDQYRSEDVTLVANPSFPKDGIGRNAWGDLLHYADPVVQQTLPPAMRQRCVAEAFPILPEAKQRELVHAYWSSVSFVDAQIGRILDALDRFGMTEHTVVVLWSDHGWHLGEHRLWSKCTNYEVATRVPLLVVAPGCSRGARTDALAELVDLYPTLCELAGLPVPIHVEGMSQVPVLRDPTVFVKAAAFSIWHGSRSIRTDRYRLTVYDKAAPKGNAWQLPTTHRHELFEYQTDPYETTNLAVDSAHAALVAILQKKLDEHSSLCRR